MPELPLLVDAQASTSPEPEEPPAPPRRRARRGFASLGLKAGTECLGWLREAGIPHEVLGATRGVETPVVLRGAVGGVRFVNAASEPMIADCRLVAALDRVSGVLTDAGVTEVRFSGAYVYRTQRNGRPSLHAEGLALDVHGVRAGGARLEVDKDYQRGVGPRCERQSILNRLVCDLDRTGLFEEVITPDDDGDHRDHVHLAIAPR